MLPVYTYIFLRMLLLRIMPATTAAKSKKHQQVIMYVLVLPSFVKSFSYNFHFLNFFLCISLLKFEFSLFNSSDHYFLRMWKMMFNS